MIITVYINISHEMEFKVLSLSAEIFHLKTFCCKFHLKTILGIIPKKKYLHEILKKLENNLNIFPIPAIIHKKPSKTKAIPAKFSTIFHNS